MLTTCYCYKIMLLSLKTKREAFEGGERGTEPPLDGAGERPFDDTLRILNKQNNANCDEIIKETNQQELGCLFRQMAVSVTD